VIGQASYHETVINFSIRTLNEFFAFNAARVAPTP